MQHLLVTHDSTITAKLELQQHRRGAPPRGTPIVSHTRSPTPKRKHIMNPRGSDDSSAPPQTNSFNNFRSSVEACGPASRRSPLAGSSVPSAPFPYGVRGAEQPFPRVRQAQGPGGVVAPRTFSQGARQAATPPSRVRCGAGFFGSSPSAPPSFASGPSLGARDLPSVGNRVFRPPARPPPVINYVIRRAGAPSPAEPAAEMGPTGSPAPRRASVRRRWLSARLDLC